MLRAGGFTHTVNLADFIKACLINAQLVLTLAQMQQSCSLLFDTQFLVCTNKQLLLLKLSVNIGVRWYHLLKQLQENNFLLQCSSTRLHSWHREFY